MSLMKTLLSCFVILTCASLGTSFQVSITTNRNNKKYLAFSSSRLDIANGSISSTSTKNKKTNSNQILVKKFRKNLATHSFQKWKKPTTTKDATTRAFSATGKIIPGRVASINGLELQQELTAKSNQVPLLLDVHATWCGPCRRLERPLAQATAVFGRTLRVAKMDGATNAKYVKPLKVQRLPALILFDTQGREMARLEKNVWKDQLVEWVELNLSSFKSSSKSTSNKQNL